MLRLEARADKGRAVRSCRRGLDGTSKGGRRRLRYREREVSHSAANEPSITLRAALRLPALRRAVPEVVAGADELDRPVRWVHAGEVPDMPSLLMGGELLLTTGMGIGKGEADQRRFAAALAERSVAALALELGSTFAEVPPALRAEAAGAGAAADRAAPRVRLRRDHRGRPPRDRQPPARADAPRRRAARPLHPPDARRRRHPRGARGARRGDRQPGRARQGRPRSALPRHPPRRRS